MYVRLCYAKHLFLVSLVLYLSDAFALTPLKKMEKDSLLNPSNRFYHEKLALLHFSMHYRLPMNKTSRKMLHIFRDIVRKFHLYSLSLLVLHQKFVIKDLALLLLS